MNNPWVFNFQSYHWNLSMSLITVLFLLESESTFIAGEFLINSYKQALSILSSHAAFQKQMRDQNVSNTSVFKEWLDEEKAYLDNLSREPIDKSLAMEYWQKLVNLGASQ